VPSLTNQENHPPNQEQTRNEWRRWARKLQQRGLAKLVTALLETGSAFSTLAAQALYISQPLLEPWAQKQEVAKFTELLENPDQTAAFTRLLKEESQ